MKEWVGVDGDGVVWVNDVGYCRGACGGKG